jgi:carboxyl-terminal processing protease
MYRQFISTPVFLILICLHSLSAQKAPEPVKLQSDAHIIHTMMNFHHCCPRTVDEQYYKDIAALFLKNLDPFHIYLTQTNIETIKNIAALKDELAGKNQTYSKAVTAIFKQQLNRADQTVSDIAAKPFDFNLNESFYIDADSVSYAVDDIELRDRLYKLMKFTALDRLMEAELLDSSLANVAIAQREAKEREIAGKIRHRRIKQRLESKWSFENLVLIYLCDAIVKAYDPHSEFVPEFTDKRNRRMINGSAGFFGLILKENYKGDVVVSNLVPGSSAWKSGAINKDDVLVSVQWEEETPIDLEGADLDEVEQAFGEKKFRKVKVTLRKTDGEVKSVILSRGRYYESDNKVQSYILDGPVKIGYIVLPSFYGDWESTYGSSCARDIDKCLEKLQFQVQGIILDMRYNGGGSLDEANQLAGIFIDEGPLGFRKQRGGFTTEMPDPYLGAQYDGPVVVMVNNESASATEYVAAALQDYNRAVIVGSPTFGKATAQRYMPADITLDRFDMNNGRYEFEGKDMVKITVAKLYRVSGLNNQLRGVQPDILLPTVFDSIGFREQEMAHVLSLDTSRRVGVYDAFAPLPLKTLRESSAQRVAQTPGFKLVEKGKEIYAERKKLEAKALPMQYTKFMAMSKTYLAEGRKVTKQIREDGNGVYKTKNYYALPLNPKDKPEPLEIEINDKLLEQITKDIYVHEAFAIAKDMVDLRKK